MCGGGGDSDQEGFDPEISGSMKRSFYEDFAGVPAWNLGMEGTFFVDLEKKNIRARTEKEKMLAGFWVKKRARAA